MVTVIGTRNGALSLMLTLAFSLAGLSHVMAEPIGLMEKYVLAKDREAMLAELIPGSEDFYFYHCLHYQTSGQLERSETTLRDWLAEHKGRETAAITRMLDRQRLLTYGDSPQRTIDHLIRRLGVKFDHAPPVTQGQRRFPSRLDEITLDVDRLVKEALKSNDSIKPLGMQHLGELFRSGNTAGISIDLKEFLQRIDEPYISQLDQLVIKELAARRPGEQRFGDLKAHAQLTLEELRGVARRVPSVADDNEYVAAVLRRMRPEADRDPSQEDNVRREYLQRVESFVRGLPASYNSLKASSTFRLLEANLSRGQFDRELFVAYLKLPRVSPIIRRDLPPRPGVKAQLGDDFMGLALLPAIGDEQPLVRTYLEHFLKDAADSGAFAEYLQPDYLRRVFAETKLLYGIGTEERWYRLLTAAGRGVVRDSIELRLAAENPKRFAADAPTDLLVDVKNIDELVIRIYEINTMSYFRDHDRGVDTDIDLDGLIPTHERKLTFNQPAVRRHREKLSLAEIDGRGVWIVDLVGKGVRARALVRRGEIHHVDSLSADGMVFTIVDENRKPVPTASMLVGSREFVADDEGRVVLPPTVDRVSRRAIISDGKIAVQINFSHLAEEYTLQAGMHLDRTQLQSGTSAQLLIRPRVLMGGTPIDPKTLAEVSVRIEAQDLEGLTTTKQVDDLELDQRAELVVPLRVPSRLSKLSVTLTGKIDRLADGTQQTLSTSRSWDIAEVRRTSHTHDALLTRDGESFVIEVRGRNGEPVSGATVVVSLTTELRGAPVQHTLQCDDQGKVHLGALNVVKSIRFGVADMPQHTRDLELNQVRWPSAVHTVSDRDIRLALADPLDSVRQRYRLIETRDNSNRADKSEHLSTEEGMLVIRPLEPGDYNLIDRSTGGRTKIAVVNGPVIESVATGKVRHRSMSLARPLGIASIDRAGGALKIKLSGNTDLARVHVYALRYLDGVMPLDQLDLPRGRLYGRRITLPHCGYVSDLRLGDEYQYVLRRRYAKKYPGVMLPQPSVILNPWETEETSSESQMARQGTPPPASAAAPASDAAMDAAARFQDQEQMLSSDYDFLADPGATLFNLRPDQDGVVTVPADVIDGLPLLQIVVSDPASLLQRTVAANLEDVETVDLRLAKSLDVKQPYSFQRAVMIASPSDPLDLASLGSAQLQVYGSVGALMKLYRTLVDDPRLDEFDLLAQWHTFDQTSKLDAYSRLASHELHLFLWSHDRGFFEEIVQPYLENKKEKQFVDDWLLGRDLSGYMTLWRYNQLNAAERVLLAMRLPEARETVQRELREYVAGQDENFAELRKGIESALRGSGLMELEDEQADADFGAVMADDVADSLFAAPQAAGRNRLSRRALKVDKFQKESKSRGGTTRGYAGSMYMGRGDMGGGGAAAFFRDLDRTKQWAESHWDRVRTVGGPQPSGLIAIDAFWSDLANQDADDLHVSSHLLRPVANRHAALVALAMCGLPLAPGDIGLPTEPNQPYAPEHPVAVVTKRLKTLEPAAEESSILIGQRFESLQTKKRKPSASEPATEPGEFLTGAAYRGQTVVSNPTSARRIVDVFWQLPAGSLPLAASQMTDSRTIVLEPFAVEAIEYQFYFPSAGKFIHYPATVSGEGRLIARGPEKMFDAVEQPTEQSTITWEKLARTGTADALREFLAGANLREIDWMLVAHRMQDQEVYRAIIRTLSDAKLPITELWAYSLKHRDDLAIREYLSLRDDLVARVGPALSSPLLEVEPIQRRTYELLEYSPLVRARIHRLREENEILNSTFLGQYQGFVQMLGHRSEIPKSEQLVLTYYLLLQNRIEEALLRFADIDRALIDTKLQYDYVDAYLAMHQEHLDRADRLAKKYVDHPVPRWQSRFAQLQSQLDQHRGLNQVEQLVSVEETNGGNGPIAEGSGDLSVMDRERRQESASEQQPEVIVRVEADSLRIDHRRAKEVTINLYGVDLELLFSKAPFVREDLQRMAMVRPTQTEHVEFEQPTGVGRFDLSDDLRRQTLLVEVVAGAARSTALYYGGEITTYVSESFGQLQTTDATSHRPIATAYVKVYAKYPDGSVRFYKDGYTDVRGRFDYASVSADDAKGSTRFAILVISDEKGATLHDVATPSR
jgi:hypothetical protein